MVLGDGVVRAAAVAALLSRRRHLQSTRRHSPVSIVRQGRSTPSHLRGGRLGCFGRHAAARGSHDGRVTSGRQRGLVLARGRRRGQHGDGARPWAPRGRHANLIRVVPSREPGGGARARHRQVRHRAEAPVPHGVTEELLEHANRAEAFAAGARLPQSGESLGSERQRLAYALGVTLAHAATEVVAG